MIPAGDAVNVIVRPLLVVANSVPDWPIDDTMVLGDIVGNVIVCELNVNVSVCDTGVAAAKLELPD